jgi:tripartite-type tricarboxylate transporter receptor subunit TctC
MVDLKQDSAPTPTADVRRRGYARRHSRIAGTACFLALATAPFAQAQTVEQFYHGKQVTMLVGSGVGGGYDVYARAFARHASKYIPGNPTIIAKNLPTAGGMAAANVLFANSETDGTTIGALANSSGLDPLLGSAGVRFDALKFNWLGSIGKLQSVCATWHTSPVKTIEAARDREVIVAGAGATSNTVIVPHILNTLLGTRFKVVAGYDPGSGLTMAVESGETEGICGLGWSTMKAARPDWVTHKRLNVLVQVSMNKLPDLPNVPSALDLTNDPRKKEIMKLILVRQEMGRPFAAPPGVPADRVAALRKAFDQTMADPDFLAEAAREHLEIEPLTGGEIDALLKTAYAAPKDIVKEAAALVGPPTARKR